MGPADRSPGPVTSPRADAGDPVAKLGSSLQMFRRRVNGALRRSDSQQAVKSPPLLVSGTLQPWVGGHVQPRALTRVVYQNSLSPEEPLSPSQGWGKPRGQQGCGALLPEPWEGKEVLDQLSEPDSLGTEGGR